VEVPDMKILGICGGIRHGNWDAAAALVVDGAIVAAAEEERFTRVKHAPGNLPTRAISYCLEEGGLDIRDIDLAVFPGRTYVNMRERLSDYFRFAHGHSPRIELCDHHEAHAASCFYTSGLAEALVVTLDFSGDGNSTTISRGVGNRIELLESWKFPQSLGAFYALITQYLGFDFGEDEYKVMGLASYGRPNVDVSWLLAPGDGTYMLDSTVLRTTRQGEPPLSPQERMFLADLEGKLGPARVKGAKIESFHQDLAASAQHQLEVVVRSLLQPFSVRYDKPNLCLAGGVAMNAVMNQKLTEGGDFKNVYLSPVSGDAGLALGAALLFSAHDGSYRCKRLQTAALGPMYEESEIRKALEEVSAPYREVPDPSAVAADAIANGKIVGWYQGRMEYGARALGHRSILADPRSPEMKDRVNAVVKFREGFRPFAPSVAIEHAPSYFKNISEVPFMTSTYSVHPEAQKKIQAVTHVDGSARVQTVCPSSEALYHHLITEVGKRTGTHVVLNTSFNIKGQPIVENPNQAISTFFGSGLEVLVAGQFVVEKHTT
jgi:carbamoyltransferase